MSYLQKYKDQFEENSDILDRAYGEVVDPDPGQLIMDLMSALDSTDSIAKQMANKLDQVKS